MPANLVGLRVFISSPGDLISERAVVKQVLAEFNRSPRYRDLYQLLSYAWEDDAPARIGPPAQSVVDDYMLRPEDADIFICMFGCRMGTPTKGLINPDTGQLYQSGTEYEFFSAYRSHQERGRPILLLLRRLYTPDVSEIQDLEQYDRVQSFFARFQTAGDLTGLVGEFNSDSALKDKLRNDLAHILEADFPKAVARGAPTSNTSRSSVFFVPSSLPVGYVERPSALDALRKALLGSRGSVGIIATTALHGMGGIGKTVLARAICDDPLIRSAFPDGILWATLGQQADPIRHQRDWIGELGGDISAASSIQRGMMELQRRLHDRAMLLVLDDVWVSEDAEPLEVGGTHCRLLITTRDAEQAEGSLLIRLDLMQQRECYALLQKASGGRIEDERQAEIIAMRLGYLPLALKIVGALLKRNVAWTDIEEALAQHDVPILADQHQSVFTAMAASVGWLSDGPRSRYLELAIFPEDEQLSEAAVYRLWHQISGLNRAHASSLMGEFRSRALIQADNTLHDLQFEYLQHVIDGGTRQHLHGLLVDAYGAPEKWSRLPDDDSSYAWRNMATHLWRAGRADELRTLLTNGTYLDGKISRLGAEAVVADCDLLGDDRLAQQLGATLRLSAHILDTSPFELVNQLYGRLGTKVRLHSLPPVSGPTFRLRSRTLIKPGGSLVRTLEGHTGEVTACAFSPDGHLALAGCRDGSMRLWEVRTGKQLIGMNSHVEPVHACAFSPDGQLALSASEDGTLQLWDVPSGERRHMLAGHFGPVYACAFSPNGRFVLSASGDFTLRLWEVASGKPMRTLEGHTGEVTACAFSPDGQLALSGCEDGTLQLWDVPSGERLYEMESHHAGHALTITACAFSPDGQLALSASEDGTLQLWDVPSGRWVRFLGKGQDWVNFRQVSVNGCAFSPDGSLALSASGFRLRLWKVASGKLVRTLEGHTGEVTACAFSSDGRLTLSASRDWTLKVWKTDGQTVPSAANMRTASVYSCAFSSDGHLVLSASGDGTLQLWEATSGKPVRRLVDLPSKASALACNSYGVIIQDDRHARRFVPWHELGDKGLSLDEGRFSIASDCALSPDGRFVLSATRFWLQLREAASGKLVSTLVEHIGNVTHCAFTPDGRLALSASGDGTLRLWDVPTGKLNRVSRLSKVPLSYCAFSQDGTSVLAMCADSYLRVWSIAEERIVKSVRVKGSIAQTATWVVSHDGRWILGTSSDRVLRLWEGIHGTEVTSWHADAPLTSCKLHPNGQRVACVDIMGNLHLLSILDI